jgi:pantetheine-phosphate adenylyltransferase
MMRIALFPGTFDPITLGHTDVINRALLLFDKIVIGIGTNTNKTPMFNLEQRMAWIRDIYRDTTAVEVQTYDGLTVDHCRQIEARFILRGIRNIGDYEYEKSIADMNRSLYSQIETIFLACSPIYTSVSSTIVRDIIKHKGNASPFLPSEIKLVS